MNKCREQVEQGQTFFTSHLCYLIVWEWKYFTKKLGMGFGTPLYAPSQIGARNYGHIDIA